MSQIQTPFVSLVTSWHVPAPRRQEHSKAILPPQGVALAMRGRIGLLDLYFLNASEIPWYAQAAEIAQPAADPLSFAAALKNDQIDKIALALTALMTDEYAGRLIGPRPRIAALATFFPQISSSEAAEVDKAVSAVRNCLYLASRLGARHVEIVGGVALPESKEDRNKKHNPDEYYREMLLKLANSLSRIYNQRMNDAFDMLPIDRKPFLCMEIEPGEAYLIRDVESYRALRQHLDKIEEEDIKHGHEPVKASDHVLLNVDVAHMMLASGGAEKQLADIEGLNKAGQFDDDNKRQNLREWIGHFHLSDHARSHAADLRPGVYHSFEEYKPWLQLALDLHNDPLALRFSATIAIELEACHDPHEAARAIGIVRSWLNRLASKRRSEPELENKELSTSAVRKGVVLVVDLANSTSLVTSGEQKPDETESQKFLRGAVELEKLIDKLCRVSHRNRGAVLSYTGDGFITFFDDIFFLSPADAACAALRAGDEMKKIMEDRQKGKQHRTDCAARNLGLRVALHRGDVYVPTFGQLKFQAVGIHVVKATRLCDWLGKTLEPALRTPVPGYICGSTREYYDSLEAVQKEQQRLYLHRDDLGFKGFEGSSEIFLLNVNA